MSWLGGSIVAVLAGAAVAAAVVIFVPGVRTEHAAAPRLNPNAEALDAGASGCGVERAAEKHLTNGVVLGQPVVKTVDEMVALHSPPVTASSGEITAWDSAWGPAPTNPPFLPEGTLVELRQVHVIAVKQEPDSDLHTIVATAAGAELNVEAPMANCDASSPYAAVLAKARAAMDAAMPNVSSSGYTPVDLTATIEGPVFYDVLHGQRGAPNGVELHPVTFFSTGSAPPPPGTTSTTSTSTTTTTTARTTTATTTTTPVRDRDYRADAKECPHWIPASDPDLRDDIHERKARICR